MFVLTIEEADSFVDSQRRGGVQVRWDGWEMVFFRSDQRAVYSKKGKWHGGKWGFETLIQPDREGLWKVKRHIVEGSRVRQR